MEVGLQIVARLQHRVNRERCLGTGMDDYLSKPLNKNALLAIIEKVSATLCHSLFLRRECQTCRTKRGFRGKRLVKAPQSASG
jgi:DNA-binding response OmpR family regulator